MRSADRENFFISRFDCFSKDLLRANQDRYEVESTKVALWPTKLHQYNRLEVLRISFYSVCAFLWTLRNFARLNFLKWIAISRNCVAQIWLFQTCWKGLRLQQFENNYSTCYIISWYLLYIFQKFPMISTFLFFLFS